MLTGEPFGACLRVCTFRKDPRCQEGPSWGPVVYERPSGVGAKKLLAREQVNFWGRGRRCHRHRRRRRVLFGCAGRRALTLSPALQVAVASEPACSVPWCPLGCPSPQHFLGESFRRPAAGVEEGSGEGGWRERVGNVLGESGGCFPRFLVGAPASRDESATTPLLSVLRPAGYPRPLGPWRGYYTSCNF